MGNDFTRQTVVKLPLDSLTQVHSWLQEGEAEIINDIALANATQSDLIIVKQLNDADYKSDEYRNFKHWVLSL